MDALMRARGAASRFVGKEAKEGGGGDAMSHIPPLSGR